jgi:neuropeptide Y receptor
VKVSLVLANKPRPGIRNPVRDEIEIKRKRRTNKMLIAMISIFVCCWLPLNLVHISSEYKEAFLQWSLFYLIFFIAHVIAMSSTIYNPFLYAFMNENFKKEFRQVLPFLFSRSGRAYQNGNATQYTNVDSHAENIRLQPFRETGEPVVNKAEENCKTNECEELLDKKPDPSQ